MCTVPTHLCVNVCTYIRTWDMSHELYVYIHSLMMCTLPTHLCENVCTHIRNWDMSHELYVYQHSDMRHEFETWVTYYKCTYIHSWYVPTPTSIYMSQVRDTMSGVTRYLEFVMELLKSRTRITNLDASYITNWLISLGRLTGTNTLVDVYTIVRDSSLQFVTPNIHQQVCQHSTTELERL